MGNISISSAVNDPVSQDGAAARLALHDDALDGVALHDGVNCIAEQRSVDMPP